MSSRTIFLLTALLLHPLYVTCLRCYVGVEGAGNVTEVDVEDPESHMCSYIIRGACTFSDKEPPVYTVYIKDDMYSKRCWYGDGVVVCSCMTELCNGDIEVIRKLWDKTKVTDENVHECVSEYLKRRPGLPLLTKEEMEPKSADIVPVVNDEEPARQRISGNEAPKSANAKSESDSDFIIFVILLIVTVVLLIALIPACIGCMALNSKRKRKRSEVGGKKEEVQKVPEASQRPRGAGRLKETKGVQETREENEEVNNVQYAKRSF
ncbi:unnamed protein product [Cylicocyclus nassatus]|uniref:Uncharacterized protein n=1 Tax=Cylicocyclus nassatus TaxID=53992 RepID=A0AA36GF25_CYLNA|nr:unnamed protein product [Cylicocyclus nassatus]